MGFRVILVEDSMSLGALYTEYLCSEGADVTLVQFGADAIKEIDRQPPDLLILDIKLPDMSGMDILLQVQQSHPEMTVIMITAHGTIDIAVDAMRSGAFDFLVKPFDSKRLAITVRNAMKQRQLVKLVSQYENSLPKANYQGFIGESLAMQTVYKTIDCVASSKASVFIFGESGTGKEVCAQAIHNAGNRKTNPFIALNCASIPKDLIESQIFGHTKGAFTGAVSQRDGAATQADGGTLFLDEICEMDLELQSKLLRFIQTGEFRRVGGSKDEKVDVRFVSATNKDPWQQVQDGLFREDLYYRLHVIPIELPPLNQRGKDILLIANKLLGQYAKEEGKPFKGFNYAAQKVLSEYHWPGNVRQLQNVIRQIVVLNDAAEVDVSMLPARIVNNGKVSAAAPISTHPKLVEQVNQTTITAHDNAAVILHETDTTIEQVIEPLWKTEKRTIESAIDLCEGNIPKAAAMLDISPSTIYRKKQSWDEMEQV
ncbi:MULTISPECIES: sigma-54-dependent transcriptional regulator [Pseudomonadati]|uniref:Sigma-54 dependent transcriptional regulator n=1 Tax=Shewanella aestuarii TaxID=1028752 RepID=A0ABT0L3N8_9GAMM|nr:sigma-54 dependent transcriptional regulator [Shewanella aestuarii]MCL1118135.1 sigma-54 dependent transcriptional regulator [Shewanella aestuarii]GGN81652.1 sigma-54-dependent Fis family transcriptional regulator [Shewanella aestuarii]